MADIGSDLPTAPDRRLGERGPPPPLLLDVMPTIDEANAMGTLHGPWSGWLSLTDDPFR
jgi:hypothetical protein